MKNISIKYSLRILALLSIMQWGCVDLEEVPLDFPGPDNFYKSPSQIQAAFASSGSRLYTAWSVYSYGAYNAFRGTDQISGGDLVLSPTHANDMWNGHYRAIADITPVFSALADDRLGPSVPQEEKDRLMAEARFLRAFNYFCLVRMYGPIPLITESTNLTVDEISRAPIGEVYDLVISDLMFAVQHLPDQWGDTPGRPTKGTAKGFLAKVYLTMATAPTNDASNYAKARDWAADVMDDGIYSLVPNIEDVFLIEHEHGPEVMWSFEATEDDPSTPPQIWLPGHMANGWTDHGVNRIWHEAYPDQPRKAAYLLLEDWEGVSYTNWPNGAGYVVRKFLYDDRANLERLLSTQNIPILRYADILLIFAEASNMANGGPTPEAVDAVNQVIDRANGHVDNPNYPKLTMSMTAEEFDAAVINERNYELCFEFDRWHDLIRKRILCDVVNPDVQVNCDDNDYLFPIPQADLRLNPLLDQNPGYPVP